ncbi:hypothetical protein F4861DRAFT_272201 [Xylaria intraflava]|nr:hypothetical protein F4861DRAFT_272201 [Xylaria intraflava]
MPKWGDKAERDLFLIMRFIERGNGAVPNKTWDKVAEILEVMGHPKFTPNGISQRWYKLLKKFQDEYHQVLGIDAGAGIGDPASSPSGRKTKRKRQVKEDDLDDKLDDKLAKAEDDDETEAAADVEPPATKKLAGIRMGTEA